MRKFTNDIQVRGYVFKHDLQKRVTGNNSKNPDTEYINGTIHVATDENALNIVPVKFAYVTATTKSGNENATYKTLLDIIEFGKTYEMVGNDATRVRINGRAACNDWVNPKTEEMASAREISGNFCHLDNNNKFEGKAEFHFDMLITNVRYRESGNGNDYMDLSGVVFDFREEIHPVTVTVTDKDGMNYFENQEISNSNPLLTHVWGNIVNTTIEKKTEVESAWGAPAVNVTTRTFRTWELAGSSPEAMVFDDESTITRVELEQRVASREANLANIRKRFNDRKNSNNAFNVVTPTTASPTATVDYGF